MRSWLPKLVLLASTVLLLEGVLLLAATLSRDVAYLLAAPWERDVPIRESEELGFVGSTLRRDHDARGFRNPAVPDRADVVAMGDSQTYGTSVASEESWPHVLARSTGATVYSMALPGHSPAHGLLRVDEALALEPRFLAVAIYFGNDLYDGFALARIRPELREGVPADLWNEAATLEEREPFVLGFERLFQDDAQAEEVPEGGIRRWISAHSRLYGLARAIRYRLAPAPPTDVMSRDFEVAAAALTERQRGYFSVFEGGGWRTILTAGYRDRVMDPANPRLRAGFAVTVAALRALDEAAGAAGARLVVVWIPTKETVFAPRVGAPSRHPGLEPMLRHEAEWRQALLEALPGIPVVDGAEALRAAPAQPYFENSDGHPNPLGQRVLARAVQRELCLLDAGTEAPGRDAAADFCADLQGPERPSGMRDPHGEKT